MKKVSDILSTIAVTLDVDYIRSFNLTEADFDVHNLASDKAIMVYNGPSSVTTEYQGAMIIDQYTCQIYMITKKTRKDMLATDLDVLLEDVKRLVDQLYFEINAVSAVDLVPYTISAVEVMTDAYIGLQAEVVIPLYNDGC